MGHRWRAAICGAALLLAACGGGSSDYRDQLRTQLPVLDARVDAGNAAIVSALSRPSADHKPESEQTNKVYRDMTDTVNAIEKESIPGCLDAAKADIQGLLKEYRDQAKVFSLASDILGRNDQPSYFIITPNPATVAATKARLKVVLAEVNGASC